MQKIDTYLIKWYGPFSSRKKLKDWEDKRHEVFNLYAFQAKRKGIKDKWWNTDGNEIKRRIRNSVPSVIPEVMEYYSETNALYGVHKLKHLGYL